MTEPSPSIEAVLGLDVTGARKAFGATVALDDVGVKLGPGEIRALIGANGSGKSTLIKALAGYHVLDAGRVVVKGRELNLHRLGEEAKAEGLRFVHQDLALIPTLSVAENLSLERGYIQNAFGSIDNSRQLEYARERLERVGLDVDPRAMISSLGPVERTLVAVTRALDDVDPTQNVLLLDEPTARLPQTDASRLIGNLLQLSDRGLPIMYVTHRLEEVYELAETITVLRDGRQVYEGRVDKLPMGELRALVTGLATEPTRATAARQVQDLTERALALEVKNLSSARLRDVNLTIRAGEILGVTGLIGSGRSELGRVVYGLQPYGSGSISIAGTAMGSPRSGATRDPRVGYNPQERRSGLLARLSITDNTTITSFSGSLTWYGLKKRSLRDATLKVIHDLRVLPSNPDAKIDALSGGNQQKVSLGKWVRMSLDLLILDEPTQSIDVGAKAEMMRAIRSRAREEGLGVLWLESDIDEIVKYSDRILIMVDGRIEDEFHERPFRAAEILASVYGDAAVAAGRGGDGPS